MTPGLSRSLLQPRRGFLRVARHFQCRVSPSPFLIHLPRHRVVQRGLGLGQLSLQSGFLGDQGV